MDEMFEEHRTFVHFQLVVFETFVQVLGTYSYNENLMEFLLILGLLGADFTIGKANFQDPEFSAADVQFLEERGRTC